MAGAASLPSLGLLFDSVDTPLLVTPAQLTFTPTSGGASPLARTVLSANAGALTLTAIGGGASPIVRTTLVVTPSALTLTSSNVSLLDSSKTSSPASLPHFGLLGGATEATLGSVQIAVNPAAVLFTGADIPYLTPPTILTATLPNATVGVSYSTTLVASGGPVVWSVSGAFPAWATLNASTGEISGTPSSSAVYSFSIIATSATGAATVPFTITVPLVIEGDGEIPVIAAVVATALTLQAQDVNLDTTAFINTQLPVSAGSLSFSGQAPALARILPLSAGTFTFIPQEVLLHQTITSGIGLPVSPGHIYFNAQTLSEVVAVPFTAASLTFTAQDVDASRKLPLSSGALQFNASALDMWRDITVNTTLSAAPGHLQFTGVDIDTATQTSITPAHLSFAAPAVSTFFSFPAQPGQWIPVETPKISIWVVVQTRN